MENLTFEQLPKAVTVLIQEISELKQFLQDKKEIQPTPQVKLLTIKETADFLSLSVPTIYSKVSRGELPVMKRNGRLYFSTEELVDYLKGGRRKTNKEIEDEANAYLLNSKKGLKNGK